MDPKQTSPLGGTPVGGQEGQNPSSASAGANSGASPVFSSGTDSAPAGTPASDQKMPGTLGAENLSTGANVSRTMDSLNSKNQSETGTSVFSKHKFDRAEPDGSILIPESQKGLFFRKSKGGKENDTTGSMIAARGETTDGLDPETRRKRKMMRIGGITGAVLAGILAIVIVVVLVAAPRPEKPKPAAGNQISAAEIKAAYESYLSYLLYGDDSGTEEKFEETWKLYGMTNPNSIPSVIYAENQLAMSTSDDRSNYFNELNSRWEAFSSIYNNTDLVSADSMNYVPTYFYHLSRVNDASTQEILEVYMNNGEIEARNKIGRISEGYDEASFMVQDYMHDKQNFLYSWVDVLNQLKVDNCLDNNGLPTCNEEIYNEYTSNPQDLDKYAPLGMTKNNMRENAIAPIQVIYADVFGLLKEIEEETNV